MSHKIKGIFESFSSIPSILAAGWTLFFPRKEFDKLLFVARYCDPTEVQFLGDIIIKREERQFLVTGIHLLRQQATGGSADFEPKVLAEFISSHEHPERIKLWVHSHVRMGNFWSTIDEHTIKRLVSTAGWFISVVMCADGSCKARVDVDLKVASKYIAEQKDLPDELLPFLFLPSHLSQDNISVSTPDTLTGDERESLKKEVDEKVSRTQAMLCSGVHEEFQRQTSQQRLFTPAIHRGADGRFLSGNHKTVSERLEIDRAEEALDDIEQEEVDDENTRCEKCRYNVSSLMCQRGYYRDEFFFEQERDVHCQSFISVTRFDKDRK